MIYQNYLKRVFDVALALLGLCVVSIPMVLIAIMVKLDSRGPILFKQIRVGKHEKAFKIYKFRTMYVTQPNGSLQITSKSDGRITKVGAFLRASKLDELPQLINVVIGNMSLVGPRPEVEKYVAYYDEENRARILTVRPGITDFSSIYFRNESELLEEADEPEQLYINKILPIKINFYLRYVDAISFITDTKIIFLTLLEIVRSDSSRKVL
tara:strand:+ start:1435 stop:2067 length:633 start_codon:yes stop_codon:yes gene_type:complete